jgi:DNA repair protein RadD
MIHLRAHQEACCKALLLHPNKFAHASVAVSGGKSLIMGRCAQIAASRCRTLIVAHTEELVEQDLAAVRSLGVDGVGCCASLKKEAVQVYGRVTVGSIKTVLNRLSYFQDVGLLLIDEAHRIPEKDESEYRVLIRTLRNAMIRGVTGTAYRADGSGSLSDSFGPCVYVYSFADALDDGFVKPLRAIEAKIEGEELDIDTTGVKISNGEWSGELLRNRGILLAPQHAKAAVPAILEEGRRCCISFCVDIEHAEVLASELSKHGLPSVAVHSKLRGDLRRYWVNEFRAGRLASLVSVLAFNTGFSVDDVDSIILARPMRSRVLYEQSLGRGARLSRKTPDCVVVDFGGNIARHGPIDMVFDAHKAVKREKKEREPGETSEVGDEENVLMLGRDLRKGASADRQILAGVRERAGWLSVVGQPRMTERGQILVPTQAGDAKWPSAYWPVREPAKAVYCKWAPYRGLVAEGLMDHVGMVWQAT